MENINLEINVDHIEEISLENGRDSFVIYININNNSSVKRNIKIKKSIYVTNENEQLEQDIWLSGYIINEAILLPNTFQKAGLIFYKPKLKSILKGDRLFVTIELEKEGTQIDYCLENNGDSWNVLSIDTSNLEIPETPKQIAKRLSKKIERFEAIEEQKGIRLENLSVILGYGNQFSVIGEVHSIDGQTIQQNIDIECIVYNSENMIINSKCTYVNKINFVGFDIFKMYCDCDYKEASRIRLMVK